MAGLKLKSGADFCNFEAFRMRLHNAGEDPTSDFGVGQIYFNTSDTSVGSARHVRLYDGTKFRSLAYLDDVDSRIKTIEDMLSVDTAEGVVSTWNEIQAFLDSVQEGTDLMDLLNDKLSLSKGGTISKSLTIGSPTNQDWIPIKFIRSDTEGFIGNGKTKMEVGMTDGYLQIGKDVLKYVNDGTGYNILTSAGGTIEIDNLQGLIVNRTNGYNSAITFKGNKSTSDSTNSILGYLGFSGFNNPCYFSADGTGNILLHSGNIGSYKAGDADKLGGLSAPYYMTSVGSTSQDINQLPYTINRPYILRVGAANPNLPNAMAYGNLVHFTCAGTDTAFQLMSSYSKDLLLYRRGEIATIFSNPWKTIAFTDSTVEAAQKLVTSSGASIGRSGSDYTEFGLTTWENYLNGSKVIFRNASGQTMRINESGNVTIGGSDLAGTSAKLAIDGRVAIFGSGNNEYPALLLSTPTYGLQIAGGLDEDNNPLPISFGWRNSTATPLTINSSGNVLIGTTEDDGRNKLQVAGHAFISNTVSTGSYFDLNRSAVTGVISDTTRMAIEMQAQATSIRFSLFDKNGSWKGIPMEFLENGDVHVSGNLIVDGEVSAGGAAEEGGNAGGGGAFHSDIIKEGATQTTIAHGLGTDDIVVSIYEKDGVSGRWSIILTDVEIVDANNIIVSFGSATTVEHKVVIMGAVA